VPPTHTPSNEVFFNFRHFNNVLQVAENSSGEENPEIEQRTPLEMFDELFCQVQQPICIVVTFLKSVSLFPNPLSSANLSIMTVANVKAAMEKIQQQLTTSENVTMLVICFHTF
jgi:hypothetical protein